MTNVMAKMEVESISTLLKVPVYGVPFVSLFHKQNLHSIGNYLPTIAFLLAMIVIFFDNF